VQDHSTWAAPSLRDAGRCRGESTLPAQHLGDKPELGSHEKVRIL